MYRSLPRDTYLHNGDAVEGQLGRCCLLSCEQFNAANACLLTVVVLICRGKPKKWKDMTSSISEARRQEFRTSVQSSKTV